MKSETKSEAMARARSTLLDAMAITSTVDLGHALEKESLARGTDRQGWRTWAPSEVARVVVLDLLRKFR